jgi:hypothetical protein
MLQAVYSIILSQSQKRLVYTSVCGLGKIYTEEKIKKAKLSPCSDREYGLQYLGKTGNVYRLIKRSS